ncbi:aldehyde dehydrogenase family protein [Rhodococcoides yunnanense]|uniref:aldehyde dehydrogenase family protein n=1 Tax=Rhodococcoides yunnanense TaxID=278209 RepID=UPI000932B5E9|nr:aldehyde dehydrogenase family protein [Rhodococcus yunnanensis]
MTAQLDAPDLQRALALATVIDTRLYIGGRYVAPARSETIEVLDPATASVIATVSAATAPDIDAAVHAAREAFRGPWSRLTPSARATLLRRLADRLEAAAEDFALVESLDNGKPLALARGDIAASIEVFRYYAGWADKIDGRSVTPSTMTGWQGYTRKKPIGVVGQIIPWNFPLNMASWKLAPALATGNTVVLKPSELTPLTALMLAGLVDECGFPPGVVNIVPGYGAGAGAALAQHPGVDKIAFTGSVETGRSIGHAAVDSMKRVSLELGGKSPTIVLPDADVESAIAGVCHAIFTNQGEVCTAGSRAFVHEKLYDRVLAGIIARIESITVGGGLAPGTEMGPLISAAQRDKVDGFVERARTGGATVYSGATPSDSAGFFYPPTVVADVARTSEIATQEVFGPVLVVHRYTDADDVAAWANDSEFGLAAGIFGRDISAIMTLADRLDAGSVWVNGYHGVDPTMPFGGFKSSGWGRELGPDALDLYTETTAVNVCLG